MRRPRIPSSVGSWNFLSVESMLAVAYFTTAVPKIWWRVGARDPLVVIFVPANLVSAGGWSGCHLPAPTPAWLLPWPISMAAHPVMPWFISKALLSGGVPSVGLTTPNASHELVEAVTDPIPLQANVDLTKVPAWVGGEIADSCSVGTPAGVATTTRFGRTVARHWSNASSACVG